MLRQLFSFVFRAAQLARKRAAFLNQSYFPQPISSDSHSRLAACGGIAHFLRERPPEKWLPEKGPRGRYRSHQVFGLRGSPALDVRLIAHPERPGPEARETR